MSEIKILSADSLPELMEKMLNNEITFYRETEEFLNKAPKGRLYCDRRSNKVHYRQRIIKDGKVQDRFLDEHDASLTDSLALKSYYMNVERISSRNIQTIKDFVDNYTADVRTVGIDKCPDGIRERVSAVLGRREQWQTDWMNAKFRQSQYKPEEKNIKTLSGIYVRTKSEEKIADRLFSCGFAFRYEQAIVIGGELRYPDFVILHPFSTPTCIILIVWEHAGMMDDQVRYEPGAMSKLRLYADFGLIVNLNMILTTETKLCRLSTDTVNLEITRLMGMVKGSPVIEVDGYLEIAD